MKFLVSSSAWFNAWMGVFLLALGVPAVAQDKLENLSVADVFALAEAARTAGEMEDALALYEGLSHDPDIEIRTEARFRKGMLLSQLGRNADAAIAFRAIIDEKPNAARVRLELARVLALLGDESGARRALRQARAAGLPPEVIAVVDQFAAALRSTKRAGGSFEFGLVPDSNINRATSARTLDTVIAPLILSEDARAQSGVGLQGSGQLYVRVPLADRLSLVPRTSARGQFYGHHKFDDISASTLVGLEWALGSDRFTPSVGRTWRWYGGPLYATTDTMAFTWLHPVGQRAQLTVSGSAARASYKRNALQSGGLFNISVAGEYALSRRLGLGAWVGVTRQEAHDPGYATTMGALGVHAWRDAGRTTLFASVDARRTIGDARLFLFPERREDWFLQVSVGATLRWLAVQGFAPVIRVGVERNASTIGLYDYSRLTTEFGITRAF
jgi:hypothetical protein